MTGRLVIQLAALGLVLLATADAQASPGTVRLAGRARLAVRGCGADREPNFSSNLTLLEDGTWTAEDPEGGLFAGTWLATGTSGRTFDLFFDAPSQADLVATIAEDVGLLCDTPGAVTVTSSVRKRFSLKLNRRRSKATLALRYVFRGHAGNGSGSAGYRIRAAGAFVPVS